MVATVDELEAAGFAERVASPTDRRVRVIRVTAAGKRRLAQADRILDRVREDVLGALPDDEREIFLHSLATLACERSAEPLHCTAPCSGAADRHRTIRTEIVRLRTI